MMNKTKENDRKRLFTWIAGYEHPIDGDLFLVFATRKQRDMFCQVFPDFRQATKIYVLRKLREKNDRKKLGGWYIIPRTKKDVITAQQPIFAKFINAFHIAGLRGYIGRPATKRETLELEQVII